jgi:hypothetical protein
VAPFDTALLLVGFDDSYPTTAVVQTFLLARALPPRVAQVSGPLGEIIRTEYGLTSDSPHYRALEAVIRSLNPNLQDLASAPVLVPPLPRFRPQGAPAARRLLDVKAAMREIRGLAPKLLSSVEEISTLAEQTTGRAVMRIELPVASLRTRDVSTLLAQPGNTLVSYPLNVTFGQSKCTALPEPFVDRVRLGGALREASRDVTLFILDTGWPDEASWRSSRGFLWQICLQRRKECGMEGSMADLRVQSGASFPPPTWAGSPEGDHSQHIQRALSAFDGLDDRVNIVYVPLVRDQGSADVLGELMEQRYLAGLLAIDGRPCTALGPPLRAQYLKEAHDEAQARLPSIPPAPQAGGSVKVDGAVVTALLHVANADARASKRAFFVNESWWSLDDTVTVNAPRGHRGFIVAAVGNENGKSVDGDPPILFAGTAREDPHTLAVMCLDPTGHAACCTSVVDYASPELAATGYYGVVDAKTCGSSFAAPRVAWILAARETLSQQPISDPVHWAAQIKGRLKRLRRSGAMPESLLFDPIGYLTAADMPVTAEARE